MPLATLKDQFDEVIHGLLPFSNYSIDRVDEVLSIL